jgi:hypothetical protein
MSHDPTFALESVANAHTAADLHVRPVSKTALVSRSWAPRAGKKYTMGDFPQSSDATRMASLQGGRPQGAAHLESKFLNHREESQAS